MLTVFVNFTISQTRQASHSAVLKKGISPAIELINGLKFEVEFNPDKEILWFIGESNDLRMFITEYIPLSDPNGTGILIGRHYKLDNMYATIEYKVIKIVDNKVTGIWFRVAEKTVDLPPKKMI
jgi:hypothetical protein